MNKQNERLDKIEKDTFSVKRLRAKVFQEIYEVDKFSEILELFENEYISVKNKGFQKIQGLYKRYSYAIYFMYSPSSIRNNLVKFKNIIKKNGGKYQAVALETFTVDAVYTPIKKKDEKTKRELKAKIQAGTNETPNPQVLETEIKKLDSILKAGSYKVAKNQKKEQVRAYHIVAMLGLATGRRFTELMKTLIVQKRGTKVTFSGLLKGNDKPIEGNIIHLSYSEVKKYLTELRKFAQTENMSESEVNSKYAKVFNNAIKRMGYTNVKATRHNYSVAGSQLFKKQGESVEDTITRILGHKEVFTSALNYT